MTERLPRYFAAAICAVTLLVLATDARAAENWRPPFERVAGTFRAQLDENTKLERQVQQLSRENRRLRRHLSGYGLWVRHLRRDNRLLRRQAQIGYQVHVALDLTCVVFPRYCADVKRKIRCESHNWPFARNPTAVHGEHATGLGQFLPSTYRSTPFGRLPIYDPYANAMAVGWMHEHGRGDEWQCR